MKKSVIDCPLCFHPKNTLYSEDKFRQFYQCSNCGLVFVLKDQILSPEKEKSRYQNHQNFSADLGYHTYLTGIFKKCALHLNQGENGLDFGCGESKLLGQIFSENGFPTDSFDLYFHSDEEIWSRKYDFIVMSEVIEHLRNPSETLLKLRGLLSSTGKIFIKTKFLPKTSDEFDQWFYKRDLTHIQFFNPQSMKFVQNKLGFSSFEELSDDLYLMKM